MPSSLPAPARVRVKSHPPTVFTTTATADKKETTRYEELEAYRGLAALGIVLYHAYQSSRASASYVYEDTPVHILFRNLEAGVSWFFALSGFLIFLPFARAAVEQGNPQSARGFLIRRAVRIIPLYFVAILVVWSWRYYGNPEQWLDLVEHLTFTQIFDPKFIFYTIGPAWSLSVEMIFYMLMVGLGPLAYWVCSKLKRPESRLWLLFISLSLMLAGSLLYKGWAYYIAAVPENDYPVYFGILAKFDNFAVGMLIAVLVVALASRKKPLFNRVGAWSLRLVALSLLVVTFCWRPELSFLNLYFHTISALAFGLILLSTVFGPSRSGWKNFFARPSLQFLGLISYSLYLWHEPILLYLDKRWLSFYDPLGFVFSTLILIGISVGAAWLSYLTLEYPTMLLRHLFNRQGRLARRYPDQQSDPSPAPQG